MSDAPRLIPADTLTSRTTEAPLFERVKSRTLKAVLQEAVQRMNGVGDDAESHYQRALAAVREAGTSAIDALATEFTALGDYDYVNRWGIVQLLHDVADPRALSLLDRIIASPMPEERSRDPHSSTIGREVVVRTTAVEAIARLAAAGSAEARDALLKYAGHPLRSVRIAAALAYLEQEGAKGRSALLRRMAKADQWMLRIRRVHPGELPAIEGHRFLPPKSAPELRGIPTPVAGAARRPATPGSASDQPPPDRPAAAGRPAGRDRAVKRARSRGSRKG